MTLHDFIDAQLREALAAEIDHPLPSLVGEGTRIQKMVTLMPVTVEAIIDDGGWDTLSPKAQADYLTRQAKLDAWRRSWRGRWYTFTDAFHRITHRLARWPQPEFIEDEEWE